MLFKIVCYILFGIFVCVTYLFYSGHLVLWIAIALAVYVEFSEVINRIGFISKAHMLLIVSYVIEYYDCTKDVGPEKILKLTETSSKQVCSPVNVAIKMIVRIPITFFGAILNGTNEIAADENFIVRVFLWFAIPYSIYLMYKYLKKLGANQSSTLTGQEIAQH